MTDDDLDFGLSEYVGDRSVERIQDLVHHPKHYIQHPSGIEAIEITEGFNFCVGNAIKYLWRAGLKDDTIQDLRKAIWYIEREIQRRQRYE